MYCDGYFLYNTYVTPLNKVLKYIVNNGHIEEYDRNLNNLSIEQLIDAYKTSIKDASDQQRKRFSQEQFKSSNNYKIVKINSFEEAQKYSQYTPWCITQESYAYNLYTCAGANQFYFCLRSGFENVPKEQGENYPLDEYGLSMIAVCVDEDGDLATCSGRWNTGNDSIMDEKEISQLIGQNFYNVFKPENRWDELVDSLLKRVQQGEDPYKVFDYVEKGDDDTYCIQINDKYNFILNGKLLSDKWFDCVWRFSEGFASVWVNKQWYFIDRNFNFISKQGFDDIEEFCRGFGKGKKNGVWYLIDAKGNLYDAETNQPVDNLSESIKRNLRKVLMGIA